MSIRATVIDGLLLVDLAVHADERGWFKENWQRQKMVVAGLPDFEPVQHNVSFNEQAGTIRGIHAEPWDKLVSVVTGRVFAAWVDLRAGEGFGRTFWTDLDPHTAVFVPRGVANSYQTLVDQTTYSYLVNAHWRPDAHYVNVNLLDETLAIPWPLDVSAMSEKDRAHPLLVEVTPVPPARVVVLGANGQLGRALRTVMPDAEFHDRQTLDLGDPASIARFDWSGTQAVINAAAFTDVDGAETPEGRRAAWAVNVGGTVALAQAAITHGFALVAISSDYVFDGEQPEHEVSEPVAPLGVYGQTKAAMEAVVATVPRHHIVRTSWVVGEGHNFVATMKRLAQSGVSPEVVNDQFGRLTAATDLAKALGRLIEQQVPTGISHLTGDGPVQSWWQIARDVFAAEGRDPDDVKPVSTAHWASKSDRPIAPRPRHSTLVIGSTQ